MGTSNSKLLFSECLGNFIESSPDTLFPTDSLLGIHISVEEMFEIISADAIRDLRNSKPKKLAEMLRMICDVSDASHESFCDSWKAMDAESSTKLSTCVRLMSRILPIIHDTQSNDEFSGLFWNSTEFPTCLDDVDHNSIAHALVTSLFKLPFVHGFTIPAQSPTPSTPSSHDPTRVDPDLVWGRLGGFAGLPKNRTKPPVSHQILMNRIEVTRLIIIALTSPLFQTISDYKKSVPMINKLFVSGDFPHTSDLAISLLVTVLEYETWHYAVPVLTTSILSSDQISPEEQLLGNCLNIFNILVDPLPTSNETYINVFRDIYAGSGITEPSEILILRTAFREKLCSIFAVNSSLKFSVTNKLKNAENFILFTYNLVSMNPRILAGSFDDTLLHSLLFLLLTRSGTRNSAGLIQTTLFILLAISANREYVLANTSKIYTKSIDHVLSRDMRDSNSPRTNFHLFILVLGNLIRTKQLGETAYEIFFTAVNNMAPFVSGFDSDSGRTFVWLLDRFSRPNWYSPKFHPSLVLMLETIDNCIHYQYDQNAQLVYSLVQGDKGRQILKNLPTDKPLPTESLTRLLNYLCPRLEEVCRRNEGNIDDSQVVELIRKLSVIGILPVPHAIVIRQYAVNDQTRLWFTSYLWGTIFTGLQFMPFLDWSRVRMIVLSAEI